MKDDDFILRCRKLYWADSEFVDRVINKPIRIRELSEADITFLIKELDRRLCQYAEKVRFERENNLVDYSPIKKRLDERKGY